jgi:hypothetical protein
MARRGRETYVDTHEEMLEWLVLILGAINVGIYTALFYGWVWTGILTTATALLIVFAVKGRPQFPYSRFKRNR